MKDNVRTEWVTALRSGDYDQTKGVLRDRNDKLCCLGVLCEIAVKHGVIPAPLFEVDNEAYSYANHTAWLPREVRDWAGLDSDEANLPEDDPVTLNGKKYFALSSVNDAGASFDEIADIIESGRI